MSSDPTQDILPASSPGSHPLPVHTRLPGPPLCPGAGPAPPGRAHPDQGPTGQFLPQRPGPTGPQPGPRATMSSQEMPPGEGCRPPSSGEEAHVLSSSSCCRNPPGPAKTLSVFVFRRTNGSGCPSAPTSTILSVMARSFDCRHKSSGEAHHPHPRKGQKLVVLVRRLL